MHVLVFLTFGISFNTDINSEDLPLPTLPTIITNSPALISTFTLDNSNGFSGGLSSFPATEKSLPRIPSVA